MKLARDDFLGKNPYKQIYRYYDCFGAGCGIIRIPRPNKAPIPGYLLLESGSIFDHQPWGFQMKYLICLFMLLVPALGFADPIQWTTESGGNGHWYEFVAGELNWEAARQSAGGMEWNGLSGHLATLTSETENNWVWVNLGEPNQAWIGGYQVDPSAAPNEGWAWITDEPWEYTNWWTGEPNDAGTGNEFVIQVVQTGKWNDVDGDLVGDVGMIVEYDDSVVEIESTDWGAIKALYR